MNKALVKKTIISALSLLCALLTLLSGVMSVAAWSDITQSKANIFRGTIAKNSVTLYKYETDLHGSITALPIKNAEFELYLLHSDGTEKKIGNTYMTDSSGKITVTGLSSGEYKFVETKPGYGYDYILDSSGNIVKEYFFTITAEDALEAVNKEIDAYNRRVTNSLEVIKNVEGSGADKNLQFEFIISFSDGKSYPYRLNGSGSLITPEDGKFYLKHGEKAVFENLPVGLFYDVSEVYNPAYLIQSRNNQGTIQKDIISIAEFVNIFKEGVTGTLEVKKTVSGEGADPTQLFDFTVTFGNPGVYKYKINGEGSAIEYTSGDIFRLMHNETAVFENLPVGMSYKVTEASANTLGYISTAGNMSGTIIPEGVIAIFENHKSGEERKTGSLEITKTVTGEAAESGKTFNFTVSFFGEEAAGVPVYYTINGVPSGSITDSGVISLKNGESAVFLDIPSGTMYKVVEDDYSSEGYIASRTEQSGTIPDSCRAYAAFNNHKESEPPETTVSVVKTVSGNIPESEKDRDFWFTFIKNAGEPIRFSLKAGERKTFTLAVGDTYSITEDDPLKINYIQSSVINGFGTAAQKEIEVNITNIYTGTIFTELKFEKKWELFGASGSVIPESIIVKLKNKDTLVETKTITPDSEGKWNVSFTAPKYDSEGKEIVYTIEEIPVLGFKSEVKGNVITNTYTGKIDIKVTKLWNDKNDPARPGEISVQLFKNGSPEGAPVKLSKSGGWTYTWKDLDAGSKWSVDEPSVPEGYTKTVSGNAVNDFIITNTKTDNADNIDVSGMKIWNHGINPPANRPKSITVYVKNGSTIVAAKKITAEENWQWKFSLPKYDEHNNLITYTVDEALVSGYNKKVDGNDLINTYIGGENPGGEEKVVISGVKKWDYKNAPEDDRPKSIIVYVKKDGKTVFEKIVTAAEGWKYSFELPAYEADGTTPAVYTVEESNVPHYTHEVDGYNLKNTYKGKGYPGDLPKTGDTFRPWLWTALFFISAAALLTSRVYVKKKSRIKEKSRI